MAKETKPEQSETNSTDETEKKICGIIMPISATDGYSSTHWDEVMAIVNLVVREAGFIPNIVSDAEDVGIIHNRIVNNLAENPIVICDVSSKNPNVMFELGLRLAFDKATIIIKDEKTPYTFDTSAIEHIPYPSDLHYFQIEKFKKVLTKKLLDTYAASLNADYSTFLKHFVRYKPVLKTEEVPTDVYLQKQLITLLTKVERIEDSINIRTPYQDTKKSYSPTQILEVLKEQLKVDSEKFISIIGHQLLFLNEAIDFKVSSTNDKLKFFLYNVPSYQIEKVIAIFNTEGVTPNITFLT